MPKRHPLIAIPTFPGTNGDVDNLRALKRCGFDCFLFRWNDSLEKLKEVDGYFFGAGFSYEDRGRSGMVAARDPLFRFLREEATKGKVLVGNCNGAQVLVESGLIPIGDRLRMCLARNAIHAPDGSWRSPGFLNEWVWIKTVCKPDRCATSAWSGTLHVPIAHGEGRFITRDPELIAELRENDQIAFCYCDEEGHVSDDPLVTPNGSTGGIAGICNPEGNVVALMPHPERTTNGDPYFRSIARWIASAGFFPRTADSAGSSPRRSHQAKPGFPRTRTPMPIEIFIDTIITNNEERTVEQAARRIQPALALKQLKYIGLSSTKPEELLSHLSFFNPHKEIAYVRTSGRFRKWNSEKRSLEASQSILKGIALLRRDEPDTAGTALGGETGVCYDCRGVDEKALLRDDLCEVFCNPHSSTLERMGG